MSRRIAPAALMVALVGCAATTHDAPARPRDGTATRSAAAASRRQNAETSATGTTSRGPAVVAQAPPPAALPEGSETTAMVAIAPAPNGLRVIVEVPGSPRVELATSVSPTADELAAMPASLTGRRVTIAADQSIRYAAVVAVMDALRARGVTHMSLAVQTE
ncbi:MAG: biopolymer transporter ExbD [Deltaproteobacteria bacterium]|nr:biopolymer transporter ExbD [Deltaproteobacteria bacterium]